MKIQTNFEPTGGEMLGPRRADPAEVLLRFPSRAERRDFVAALRERGTTAAEVLLPTARRFIELAKREQPTLAGLPK